MNQKKIQKFFSKFFSNLNATFSAEAFVDFILCFSFVRQNVTGGATESE
jgi:hypothetical protein